MVTNITLVKNDQKCHLSPFNIQLLTRESAERRAGEDYFGFSSFLAFIILRPVTPDRRTFSYPTICLFSFHFKTPLEDLRLRFELWSNARRLHNEHKQWETLSSHSDVAVDPDLLGRNTVSHNTHYSDYRN
jgi:hypothetical protein